MFKLSCPLDILLYWHQLGDENDVRNSFAGAIESDVSFVRAMSALSTWANSSDRGIHHPLHKYYIAHFVNADDAKARLERLTGSRISSLRKKAKSLLSEWDERSVN
jgi:hypothetical protein